MNKRVKTARGKTLDMAALAAKNEKTRAVGNIPMNARGDRLNPDGSIRVSAEEIARAAQNKKSPPTQTAVSEPKPLATAQPAPPAPEDKPQPVSKITKTRDDGSQYAEIEYDDGSIETVEIKGATE
jgi:hypothetical protein